MSKNAKSATARPSTATLTEKTAPKLLPQFKVILHNDDKNEFGYVTDTIVLLCAMNKEDAQARTMEADKTGCALLLITHKERAELFVEQFQSRSLTVTIEPVE
ncbi:MAG TPA: ATP-dependent Clp protease adaptor ClpS [Phycisphaerae bacterium]|nr:ATP-dependent Clp protease adaptor ClpS [Phycisphaerae bacterium]